MTEPLFVNEVVVKVPEEPNVNDAPLFTVIAVGAFETAGGLCGAGKNGRPAFTRLTKRPGLFIFPTRSWCVAGNWSVHDQI